MIPASPRYAARLASERATIFVQINLLPLLP